MCVGACKPGRVSCGCVVLCNVRAPCPGLISQLFVRHLAHWGGSVVLDVNWHGSRSRGWVKRMGGMPLQGPERCGPYLSPSTSTAALAASAG